MGGQTGSRLPLERGSPGERGPQYPGHLFNLEVEVQGPDLEFPLTRIGQDLRHQVRGPVEQLLKDLELGLDRVRIGQPGSQQFQIADHGAQKVVEVVGDPGRQQPQ